VDRSELVDLASQLASPELVKHKERAVRVLTACGIANILRLFAPDAPYSIDQFETIFALFLHQLKGVSDPSSPFYNYHYFLLESLSTVKSIVLIFDLPQGESLQRDIIQMALDMMHPSLLKNVKLYLLELVQTLLEECDQISVDLVVDLLVPHLMGGSNQNSSATGFVHDLVRQCPDKLQAPLAVHLSDQLARIARAQESDTVLTRLGREMHEYAVNVAKLSLPAATCIFSLLEEELKVENPEIRMLSIQSLAQIFTHHHTRIGTGSLQGLWANWLGRRNDKSARCRCAWVRGALELFNTGMNRTVCETLLPHILERLQDPDEKVRLTTLQCINSATLTDLPDIQTLIEAVTDRCLDRKEDVQNAALLLSSNWVFNLLHAKSSASKSLNKSTNGNSNHVNLLITRLLQLPFSESRIHSIAFLGYLEKDIFVRLAREFPQVATHAAKLVQLLSQALQDSHAHSALRALLHHKSQFIKAWTGLLKLSRIPEPQLTDIHRAKIVQVSQFLAERIPGIPEIEAQRSLLSLPSLKISHSDAHLLQMMIDLAEGRGGCNEQGLSSSTSSSVASDSFNLLGRIEAHIKASTSLSASLKRVITAALPFGSQISINSALIGQLTFLNDPASDGTTALLLQNLLLEFPQMFENRTVELVSAVIRNPSASNLASLSQYLSSGIKSKTSSSKSTSIDPEMLVKLDETLSTQLHPPLGDSSRDDQQTVFEPKISASAAQVTLNLNRQGPAELIQVT
jgi:hypothetical protein